jgi:hypothetical protein
VDVSKEPLNSCVGGGAASKPLWARVSWKSQETHPPEPYFDGKYAPELRSAMLFRADFGRSWLTDFEVIVRYAMIPSTDFASFSGSSTVLLDVGGETEVSDIGG